MTIDLNCDLGEGSGNDAEIMPLITSVNIACGAHAGTVETMRTTVALAERHGVAIGAHPGFDDPEYFGRRELSLSPAAVRGLVERQIVALGSLGHATHVKAHGALYNMAARDVTIAGAVADAVRAVDPALVLFALSGSALVDAGLERGLSVAREVFADRTYQRDGLLTPRSRAGAVIHDESAVVAHVLRMVREGVALATDGTEVAIGADTICLHGDGARAVAVARRVHEALRQAGVELRCVEPSPGPPR